MAGEARASGAGTRRVSDAGADGPLRERLVDAATELVREQGPRAVTLRQVARRAGVSHGAPLRHFASFAELLSVVAARGYRVLSARVEQTAAALPPGAGPRARLVAASHAYVETAAEDPELFALMCRFDMLDVENEEFQREATAAFARFVDRVRAVQDADWHADRDTMLLNAVCWSQVHGIATLWSQGALPATLAGERIADVVELSMELLLGPAEQQR